MTKTLRPTRDSAFAKVARGAGGVALAVGLLAVAGCQSSGGGRFSSFSETTQHGYVVTPEALAQIPPGSSRDQVLIALGSPSTTGTVGGEVFYYISQTRYRPVAFMREKVVNQQVVAVYFDDKSEVTRVANYGLKDGKVFDYVSRTTPTGGKDQTFIQQVLTGMVGVGGNPFGGGPFGR